MWFSVTLSAALHLGGYAMRKVSIIAACVFVACQAPALAQEPPRFGFCSVDIGQGDSQEKTDEQVALCPAGATIKLTTSYEPTAYTDWLSRNYDDIIARYCDMRTQIIGRTAQTKEASTVKVSIICVSR